MKTFKAWIKMNLVNYFDRNGTLTKLEDAITKYQERLFAKEIDAFTTLHCPMYIDLIELNNSSGFVCDLLLKEPNFLQQIITEFAAAAFTLSTKDKIQNAQVNCPIVLSSFELMTKPPLTGLIEVSGIVVQHTIPIQIVRTSRWKCNQSICEGMDPQVHRNLPATPPLCSHCGAPLEEQPTMRDSGTIIELKLANKHYFHYNNFGFAQWKHCKIINERLCDSKIHLGAEYTMVGVRRNDCIDVWGCTENNVMVTEICGDSKIEMFRQSVRNSPFAFVEALATFIGSDVYPDKAYINLRKGLLLSLASINSSSPIPILVIGDDTSVPEQLMKYAGTLIPRCFKPCMPTGLSGYIKGDWKCAEALILSSNGVCYLGDWESYASNKKGETVLHAIESGRIILEHGEGEYEPLKAAVWTYWEKSGKKRNVDQIHTLLKVFGLSWRTEIDSDTELQVIEFTLSNEKPIGGELKHQELREYLEFVNARAVTLSNETQDLLRRYFVCARRARGESLPLRSLDVLTALTEAHARLNQRSVAYPEDALAVLEIYERTLGPCPLYAPMPEDVWDFGPWLQENILNVSLLSSQSSF